MNPAADLLAESLDAEPLVRRGLALLEAELRETALLALADLDAHGVSSPELFHAVAGLQRPTWGSWNGLVAALRNARKSVLRSGTPADRGLDLGAVVLARLVAAMDEGLPAPWTGRVAALAELTRSQLGSRPRLGAVLALPITLRNRIAHDMPSEASFWESAAAALRPLLQLHAEVAPLAAVRGEAPRIAPWFLDAGEPHAFNGVAHDFAIVYVSRRGASVTSMEAAPAILQAFARLLGKADVQERDLRKLLARLAPEEMKGVVLGDYLVGRTVGEGGFATVHVGRQLSTGRRVAVKILRDGLAEDAKARFQQEAAFLSRFNHPHVVGVIGHGEDAWSAPRDVSLSDEPWFQRFSKTAPIKTYIALEWIDGSTLEDLYKKETLRATPRVATEWFAQAAEALTLVHSAGLVHRDVKPGNLMVTEQGTVKLMDFGIARSRGESRTIVTTAGRAIGTPAYMSPEQLRAQDAEASVGPASDIYSLCATFYELFTGRRLYRHDTDDAKTVETRKLSGEMPERPRALVRGLSWELETILLGGLQPDVADRYASAEALERDLRRFLDDEAIQYRRPSLARRMRLGYRRNRTLANVVATALVALGLATAIFIVNVTRERDRANDNARRADVEKANAVAATESAVAAREKADDERRRADSGLARALAEKGDRAAASSDPLTAEACFAASMKLDAAAARDKLYQLQREQGVAGLQVRLRWTSPSTFVAGAMAFSRDGARIAAADDASIRIFQRTGETLREVAVLRGHEKRVRSVAFSADGARLASGSDDNAIRLWDVENARELRSIRAGQGEVLSVALAADGKRLASAGVDKTVRLWDLETGRELLVLRGHEEAALSVALSADGKRVASGGVDKTVRVWSAETGKELLTLRAHEEIVRSVALSADGKRVASGSDDRTVRIFDVETGKELHCLRHEGAASGIALSEDGKRLASSAWDKTIRLWDTETGRELLRLTGHMATIVALSADGRWVASACSDVSAPRADKTVRLWDLATGSEALCLGGHVEGAWSVAVSASGTRVVSGGGDQAVRVWDLATGVELRDFEGQGDGRGLSVAISADGKRVASGCGDGTARVWDVESGSELLCLKGQGDEAQVFGVALSADGRRLVSGSGNAIRLWDLETAKEILSLGGQEDTTCLALSADAKRLVAGATDGTVHLWDLEAGKELLSLRGHSEEVKSVALSADGKRLASGSADRTVRLWDLETGRELHCLRGHEDVVWGVALDAQGKRVVSGSRDRTVRLWDFETGKELLRLLGHEGEITSVALGADGRAIASASKDRTVRLWQLETASRDLDIPEGPVFCVRVSPDGRRFACGGADKVVRIRDIDTGKAVLALEGHEGPVAAVAFLADGRRLASASLDRTVRLWDLETGKELLRLVGHEKEVKGVSVSADGKRLASGSDDGTVRLWDLETGKEIACLRGHKKEVMCVALDAGGKRAVSGGMDGTVRLWDLDAGKELLCLQGHVGGVMRVALGADGKRLVSAGEDRSIRVWDLETGREVLYLHRHEGWVIDLSLAADGKRLASSSQDKTIRLWDLETGRELLCLRGHANLVFSVSLAADGTRLVSSSVDVRVWDLGFLARTTDQVVSGCETRTGLRVDGFFVLPIPQNRFVRPGN